MADFDYTHSDRKLTIFMGADLDYKGFQDMRRVVQKYENHCDACHVDLSQTRGITSSGLGVLLLIRQGLKAKNYNIRVKCPNLAQLLKSAHLHEHFIIEHVE
ncbi:STAS domain-containing protein [Magnetofaba australis]|nr:STAS domain-containing protein [Magnetofaba australis]